MNNSLKKIVIVTASVVIPVMILVSYQLYLRANSAIDVMDEPSVVDRSSQPTSKLTYSELGLTQVEIARTNEQRMQGLQNRESLCETCAMLFIFDSQEQLSFWMKNTTIPLDMIFVDQTGIIVTIHENTTPLRLQPSYVSSSPALYVIEVNAGWSERNNVTEGMLIDVDDIIQNGQSFDESYL